MHTCISSQGLKRSWCLCPRWVNAGNKNTPSMHHPWRRNVTTLMVGLKKRSHTQKSHPKAVNPRDIAGECKKKKERMITHFCVNKPSTALTWCVQQCRWLQQWHPCPATPCTHRRCHHGGDKEHDQPAVGPRVAGSIRCYQHLLRDVCGTPRHGRNTYCQGESAVDQGSPVSASVCSVHLCGRKGCIVCVFCTHSREERVHCLCVLYAFAGGNGALSVCSVCISSRKGCIVRVFCRY